ncbi:hypothetical protein M8J77_024599 [Diaphorina citri]|nr:hypothetical protein M8J77_024599 [Diaphorina citri]
MSRPLYAFMQVVVYAFVQMQVTGCTSDSECHAHEACLNGKCSNPCRCGPNAVCDVAFHKATCKCLPGYTGNPLKEVTTMKICYKKELSQMSK